MASEARTRGLLGVRDFKVVGYLRQVDKRDINNVRVAYGCTEWDPTTRKTSVRHREKNINEIADINPMRNLADSLLGDRGEGRD